MQDITSLNSSQARGNWEYPFLPYRTKKTVFVFPYFFTRLSLSPQPSLKSISVLFFSNFSLQLTSVEKRAFLRLEISAKRKRRFYFIFRTNERRPRGSPTEDLQDLPHVKLSSLEFLSDVIKRANICARGSDVRMIGPYVQIVA